MPSENLALKIRDIIQKDIDSCIKDMKDLDRRYIEKQKGLRTLRKRLSEIEGYLESADTYSEDKK